MINGKSYGVSCDDGQEERVTTLGRHIDQRMREIARAGAAGNESHLMILTALMLADETFELKDSAVTLDQHVKKAAERDKDEAAIAQAIDQLAQRIDHIAGRMQTA